MAAVMTKFIVASILMWIVPVVILNIFNNNLFPGSSQLSPYSVTLVSGFLAVISVNVVIAVYIYLAMKEPSDKHEPDPKFLSEAKASIQQLVKTEGTESKKEETESSEGRTKQE